MSGNGLVLVSGEALVDLIPREETTFEAVLGGSPYNTAIGLGRLGVKTGFAGRLSSDTMGKALKRELAASGVDASFSHVDPRPSPLAFVTRGTAATGSRYSFYLGATAYDGPSPLTADWSAHAAHLHIGSFAATDGVLGTAALGALRSAGAAATTSYDPNIRAFVVPPRDETLPMVEERVKLATYIKASDEDFEWLYPGQSPSDAAARWAGLGPRLVVLTRGGSGAEAHFRGQRLVQAAPSIDVADTVGAGDSFMSALLAAMAEDGALGAGAREPDEAHVGRWLLFAVAAAAITCTRQGAQPPTRVEVDKVVGTG